MLAVRERDTCFVRHARCNVSDGVRFIKSDTLAGSIDDLNDWDAAIVIERLFPEDDYSICDESLSDASASEEESVSSDNEDGSNDDPPKRKTRSNLGNHDDCRRLTRSKTSGF